MGSSVVRMLRGIGHRLAHLLDDRRPSRRSDLLVRGQDGESQVILANHDGSSGGR